MEKIKICFTSTDLNTYSETFIRNLKDGLDAKIFHCYGAMFPYLSEDKSLQSYKTPPLIDLIMHRVGLIKKPLREYYLIKYLQAQRINLIFANYGPSGAALAPIAEELNIPLIVHFHGFDASIYDVLAKYREAYYQMFSIAKAIIVVSEEMKSDLLLLGAPEEKLFKMTYSPKPLFFDVIPDYHSNQVLAIGRFVEKKAPHLTLLAFQKAKEICPELRLKFVGSGVLLPVCQDLCLSLGIKDVNFVGVLSPEEIAKEMSNSFCFIQHSKQAANGDKEGTPVVILEALAAGLPVISTLHAGIPEMVKDGYNGYLVEEGDVLGMTVRLVDLAHDRNRAASFGKFRKESNQIDFKDYLFQWNKLIYKIASN
ncbi:glycosyltransferase [Algoriphagus resistens]|uniref:glycosyltransferase n=1 Tax=Algoriphagus resistens TaxID=1750590 RepID=UPI0007167FCA|nr:glycosyltransferase [Algoriphagus resistens]